MARVGSIVFLTLAICGAGTALFHELEGWSVLDSLYFTVVTLTSVGYGDFSPTQGKPFSRAAAVALALLGMGIISALVDAIGDMQQKFFGRFARIGSLAWILAALAVLVGTAVIVLPRLEPHLSGEDAAYWSVVTLTTVGYGDQELRSDEGKLFCICFALSGLGLMSGIIGAFGDLITNMLPGGKLKSD